MATRFLNRRSVLIAGGAGLAGAALGRAAPAAAATWETVLNGSFAGYATLEAAWNYRYPWGSDHNGSARMYASVTDHNHVFLESPGVLAIRATRISWNEGNSSRDPWLPIRYHSGAIHAKQHVTVSDQFPNWEIKGEFQAPSARGAWPAFWLAGVLADRRQQLAAGKRHPRVQGGRPELVQHLQERERRLVQHGRRGVRPGAWHGYRAWITKVNAADVDIHYYLDGRWVGQHRGANFVNKPMWIIVNLQMEGSSGAPGPTSETLYRARNIYVGRTRA
ncbi:MAG TPA: glycoside hydrolase [Actinophytocola sp.]|uniref:glycoside hydrolase n=1 Tax=Actinophytocola sp. TaxID=1872138 RepID=UPI002DDDB11C|nr:glycoside hydrolase [Actinophytocola sp.]HEV2783027.1 glycoside hydrolase [Actinophytocola sp.]